MLQSVGKDFIVHSIVKVNQENFTIFILNFYTKYFKSIYIRI